MADDIDQLPLFDVENRIAALEGKPEWTNADDPDPEELVRRSNDFLTTHSVAGTPWGQVRERYREAFPGISPDGEQPNYEKYGQAARLEHAFRVTQTPEYTQEVDRSRVLRAGMGFLADPIKGYWYAAARKRFVDGKPEPDDYRTIATYEREQQRDAEMPFSVQAGQTMLRIPGEALAFLTGGKIAGAGLKALGIAQGAGAGAFLGRKAAETALMPSFYLNQAFAENAKAGRDPGDLAGLPVPFALGLMQNVIIGHGAKIAQGAVPGDGVAGAFGRIGVGALASTGEQTAFDYASGQATDALRYLLPQVTPMESHYGPIGSFLKEGAVPALKDATQMALMFAGFGLTHGGEGVSLRTMESFRQTLDGLGRKGMPRDKAGRAMMQPVDAIRDLYRNNPTATRDDAFAAMDALPAGPIREWGRVLAGSLPERPAPQEPAPSGRPEEAKDNQAEQPGNNGEAVDRLPPVGPLAPLVQPQPPVQGGQEQGNRPNDLAPVTQGPPPASPSVPPEATVVPKAAPVKPAVYIEDLRQKLLAVRAPAKGYSPAKVLSEAQRMGLDKLVEKPADAPAPTDELDALRREVKKKGTNPDAIEDRVRELGSRAAIDEAMPYDTAARRYALALAERMFPESGPPEPEGAVTPPDATGAAAPESPPPEPGKPQVRPPSHLPDADPRLSPEDRADSLLKQSKALALANADRAGLSAEEGAKNALAIREQYLGVAAESGVEAANEWLAKRIQKMRPRDGLGPADEPTANDAFAQLEDALRVGGDERLRRVLAKLRAGDYQGAFDEAKLSPAQQDAARAALVDGEDGASYAKRRGISRQAANDALKGASQKLGFPEGVTFDEIVIGPDAVSSRLDSVTQGVVDLATIKSGYDPETGAKLRDGAKDRQRRIEEEYDALQSETFAQAEKLKKSGVSQDKINEVLSGITLEEAERRADAKRRSQRASGSQGTAGPGEETERTRPGAGATAEVSGRPGPDGSGLPGPEADAGPTAPDAPVGEPGVFLARGDAPTAELDVVPEDGPERSAARPTAEPRVRGAEPIYAFADEQLRRAPGLDDAKRKIYGDAVQKVLDAMPAKARELMGQHTRGIYFHPTPESIGQIVATQARMTASLSPESKARIAADAKRWADASAGGRPGGAYFDGALHIDGEWTMDVKGKGKYEGGKTWTPVVLYGHEFGHAVDGPQGLLSRSDAWLAVMAAEINPPPTWTDILLKKVYPLTKYAQTSPAEGFAEFSRLLYGSDVPTRQIQKDFPKAWAFFESMELLPDARPSKGAKGSMPEVFSERVPLGENPANHIDVLKEPPKLMRSDEDDRALVFRGRTLAGVPEVRDGATYTAFDRKFGMVAGREMNEAAQEAFRRGDDATGNRLLAAADAIEDRVDAMGKQKAKEPAVGFFAPIVARAPEEMSAAELKSTIESILNGEGEYGSEHFSDQRRQIAEPYVAEFMGREAVRAEVAALAGPDAKPLPGRVADPQFARSDATSNKAAVVEDKERPELGLPPLPGPGHRPHEALMEQARLRAAADPQRGERLENELRAKPRQVDDDEAFDLLHRRVGLKSALKNARTSPDLKSPDLEVRARAERSVADRRSMLDELDKVIDPTKTRTARALAAWNAAANEKYELEEMLGRARDAKGSELTPQETAEITRLSQQVEALQGKLDAAERAAKELPDVDRFLRENADQTSKLRAQADALRAEIAADAKASFPERAFASAKAAVDHVRAFFGMAQGPQYITSEQTDAIKEKIERLKAMEDRLAELEEKGQKLRAIKAAGERSKAAPTGAKGDLADLRIGARKARAAAGEGVESIRLKYQPAHKKVFRGGLGTLDASRELMTTLDLSAVGRQGLLLSASHPLKAAKAFRRMIEAFGSERAADREWDAIQNDPNYGRSRRGRLYLAEPDAKIGDREESQLNKWLAKVPGIPASRRAYTTFLNRMRFDAFNAMTAALNPAGGEAGDMAIAQYVNYASGRGGLGDFERAAVPLTLIFFSPRHAVSRFQYLAGVPLWKATPDARKVIATEYARSLLGVGAFYALAAFALDDEKFEWDARSSDFGKIRIGRTRIDPLAGLSQVAVLSNRMRTGQTKTLAGKVNDLRGPRVKFGQDTTAGVLARFVRSKLAPVPGAAVNLADGKTVVGEKVTWKSQAKEMVTPLAWGEVYDAMRDQGATKGTALGLLSILGFGTQTYEPRRKADHSSVR